MVVVVMMVMKGDGVTVMTLMMLNVYTIAFVWLSPYQNH